MIQQSSMNSEAKINKESLCAQHEMRPVRLEILIWGLYVFASLLAVYGWVYLEGYGIWVSISLVSVFSAHLLSIPHNSGRIWSSFIAFCFFVYALVKIVQSLGLTDIVLPEDYSLYQHLGTAAISILIGVLMLMLCFHSSVCLYFDQLNKDHSKE